MNGTIIIQTSPMRTASTLLSNALYGLFIDFSKQPITYVDHPDETNINNFINELSIIKSHDLDIDKMINIFKGFKTFFVCSERIKLNLLIDNKYRNYDNVVIFDYDELNETETNTMNNIVDNIYNKLTTTFGNDINNFNVSKEASYRRIIDMNLEYEKIKKDPFSKWDTFYQIHGHHRNREPMSSFKKCCICGPVRNCEQYLDKVFQNVEKIGALFEEYMVVIVYDKSSDNSLAKLKQWQQKIPNMMLYVNKKLVSPYRTHRLAYARNICLNYAKQNKDKYDFFIMMDFDDVNCKNVDTTKLTKYLTPENIEKWDSLSFNTSPKYYDIWALSIYPYCFSYNHFKNTEYHNYSTIQDYIERRISSLKDGELLRCISSFNGFSIYKTNKFLNTNYDGHVRLDLIPKHYLNAHKAISKSPIIFKDYGHVKGLHEDCEHRAFHIQAINNDNAKIMIAKDKLFYV
jgi:hypothetical protein